MRGGVARGQRLMSVEPLIVLTSNIMISHNSMSPTNITITITVQEWLSDRHVLSPLLFYTILTLLPSPNRPLSDYLVSYLLLLSLFVCSHSDLSSLFHRLIPFCGEHVHMSVPVSVCLSVCLSSWMSIYQ